MSENNLISDDKMNQEILKQKSLSYKKKLVYSKYKNINNKTKIKENEVNNSAQKDKHNFEIESLRDIDPIQVSCNNTIGQLFKVFLSYFICFMFKNKFLFLEKIWIWW
jgi:hypothetical protein